MAFTRDFSALDRTIALDRTSINSIIAALLKLPKEFQRSAEKAVLRAGAQPILKAIKANISGQIINTRSGTLKRSMAVKIMASKSGWVGARIGPRSGFRYKNVTGRRGGAQKIRSNRKKKDLGRKRIDAQEVSFYLETGTPNIPARPFIRPAIDSSQGEVLGAMHAGLSSHMTKVVARLRSKK